MPYSKNPRVGVLPPSNLPIQALDAELWEDDRPEEKSLQEAFELKLQLALAYAMVVGLAVFGVIREGKQIVPAVQNVHEASFAAGIVSIMQEYASWLHSFLW